jgi:hypothetical protein
MERLFSPQIYKSLVKGLDKKKENMKYIGDISDLGNEIGIIIGELYPNMNETEINELIMGLKHGILVASSSK